VKGKEKGRNNLGVSQRSVVKECGLTRWGMMVGGGEREVGVKRGGGVEMVRGKLG